jgi:uncharacterized protein YdeI (YjbR/CyaY-like superfamily)
LNLSIQHIPHFICAANKPCITRMKSMFGQAPHPEVPVFYPKRPLEWERWLQKNHLKAKSVWLVLYTKSSGKPSISWREAVDIALCYGWIDSKKIKVDSERAHQFFCPRKPKSTWSKINKDKIEQLIEEGRMQPAGLKAVSIARENGSWTSLDEVEALVVPADLAEALREHPKAAAFFDALSKSVRKGILHWITFAKRPETRKRRIDEFIERACRNLRPAHLEVVKRK